MKELFYCKIFRIISEKSILTLQFLYLVFFFLYENDNIFFKNCFVLLC